MNNSVEEFNKYLGPIVSIRANMERDLENQGKLAKMEVTLWGSL